MRTILFAIIGLCAAAVPLWAAEPPGPGNRPSDSQGVQIDWPPAESTTRPDVEPPDASPERIAQLIRQLGDPQFERRQEAEDELAKLGHAAFEALQAAADDRDLEVATRARHLLRKLSIDLTRPDDPAEVASLLTNFHLLDDRDRIARLENLAALPEGQGIAALCRVVRFESSIVMAKYAAVALIKRYPTDQMPMDRLAKLLREHLEGSRRAPSRWMLSYAKFHDAPRDAWREWETWTNKEIELARAEDQTTDARIVAELAAQQVNWVERAGGSPEQLIDKIQLFFELGEQSEKNARPLVAWLVEQKAWDVLGVSPVVLAQRLALEPRLFVYGLAEKYAEKGQADLAEAAATKAFELADDEVQESQRFRYNLGLKLQQDGHFAWAEREFRHVISSAGASDSTVDETYQALALMLHDQAENLRAAKVLEEYVAAIKKNADAGTNAAGASALTKELTARMDYYLACHWRDEGDHQKERLALEAGLLVDPMNPELLIAAYHLPGADSLFHDKIRDLVHKAVVRMRVAMLTGSDRAIACNDFAWLVANTEGDFDEAIRASRESLEGQTDNGAYHDTLARCYYAKGDYENAVKHQIRAAELEPHSGLIAKQLEWFRQAYEKKFGKPAPKPKPPKKKAQDVDLIDPADMDPFAFLVRGNHGRA